MQLTRAADYGVRVMVHLAGLPDGRRASLAQLAAAVDVPASFLSKVLQQLARAGMVQSFRGKGGGFCYVSRETPLSVLDIITALDGLPPLNDCLRADDPCRRRDSCDAFPVWVEAQRQLHAVLRAATLESLVRAAPPRGPVAGRNAAE